MRGQPGSGRTEALHERTSYPSPYPSPSCESLSGRSAEPTVRCPTDQDVHLAIPFRYCRPRLLGPGLSGALVR